jgi:hypothetical protein
MLEERYRCEKRKTSFYTRDRRNPHIKLGEPPIMWGARGKREGVVIWT